MRIDPVLARLRADGTPAHDGAAVAVAALDRWAASDAAAPLLGDLARFGDGMDYADCPALVRLIEGDAAQDRESVAGFLNAVVAAMVQTPFAHPSAAVSAAGASLRMTLASAGRATLSLAMIDGDAVRAAQARRTRQTLVTHPGSLRVRVIAGRGSGVQRRISHLGQDRIAVASAPLDLAPGLVLDQDTACESVEYTAAAPALLLLRLHRRAEGRKPLCEWDAETGALLHRSTSDPAESRAALAMALLGRMGRAEAAPDLAALARNRTEAAPGLRWQAVREALALDTGTGFAALAALADDPADPLAAPARALAGKLCATYPALARISPAFAPVGKAA